MPKANADYGKLLRHTKADLAEFKSRAKRTERAIMDAIGDHPARARIVQLIESHAQNVHDVAYGTGQVERYQRLVDKQNETPAADAPAQS